MARRCREPQSESSVYHGRDAITPTVRGAYDVNDSYAELDIVSFDGCAYIARSDAPGLCPGDGWEPTRRDRGPAAIWKYDKQQQSAASLYRAHNRQRAALKWMPLAYDCR